MPTYADRSKSPVRLVSATPTLIVTLFLSAGCNSNTRVDWFAPTTLADDLRLALDAPNPDQRRNAVIRIGKRKNADGDAVYDVLSTVARTDERATVRCTAIRTLGAKTDPRAVDPLITILLHDQHPERTRPPTGNVLWDVTHSLAIAADRGLIPDHRRDAVQTRLISLLIGKGDRNVRIAAADALSNFFHRDALVGLIGALREEDFGIVYAAEESLVTLTGQTHNYDADAWSEWLKGADDPFAGAGLIPPGYKPDKPGVWQRAWTGTKDFFTPDPRANATR